ncbi:hypothetical protein ACIBH1_44535 [Nonomuraea sp. NPDC050663]|uniref:hypothetical protein n=1 Tax=Nonomuraea sp. NPDC050663 TaxID=3364370 RepID=UPI00379DA83F
MRDNYSAGLDGMAVWALTALTAVLSSLDAHSVAEAIFRLAAPLVAAWLWERGMAIERHRIRGTGRINWRLTPERLLVRLGLAEPKDRTVVEVATYRLLTRVALAAKNVRRLRKSEASERKIRAAMAKLDKMMDRAVEYAQLASDPERQEQLLQQIAALYNTEALVDADPRTPWVAKLDPQAEERRKLAEHHMGVLAGVNAGEIHQRVVDHSAAALMSSDGSGRGGGRGLGGSSLPPRPELPPADNSPVNGSGNGSGNGPRDNGHGGKAGDTSGGKTGGNADDKAGGNARPVNGKASADNRPAPPPAPSPSDRDNGRMPRGTTDERVNWLITRRGNAPDESVAELLTLLQQRYAISPRTAYRVLERAGIPRDGADKNSATGADDNTDGSADDNGPATTGDDNGPRDNDPRDNDPRDNEGL